MALLPLTWACEPQTRTKRNHCCMGSGDPGIPCTFLRLFSFAPSQTPKLPKGWRGRFAFSTRWSSRKCSPNQSPVSIESNQVSSWHVSLMLKVSRPQPGRKWLLKGRLKGLQLLKQWRDWLKRINSGRWMSSARFTGRIKQDRQIAGNLHLQQVKFWRIHLFCGQSRKPTYAT